MAAHIIGCYKAQQHSFHHEALMTDLSVIRAQSEKRFKEDGRSIVIHHHLSTEDCGDKAHATWGAVENVCVLKVNTPTTD